jgi:hypothetical protein
MKVSFLTSSLEPGKDGVGDYTRRLAAECIRQGHHVVLLALNDTHISGEVRGVQETEGISVPTLRLPHGASWDFRIQQARSWLQHFKPDWVSLQLVLFGFHPKGLCIRLGKKLAAINTIAPWHIMFHELWVGLGVRSSLKHRLWGSIQKAIVKSLIAHLQPCVIHTQTEPYRHVLDQVGIHASLLRLFSNIPYARNRGPNETKDCFISPTLAKLGSRNQLYLVGVFGGIHPEWSAPESIAMLAPLARRFRKRLVMILLGKNGLKEDRLHHLRQSVAGQSEVIIAGEQSELQISRILQILDLGIATSPRQIIEKSGAVAAMLEHGLPVLVTRDDWGLEDAAANPSPSLVSKLLFPTQLAFLSSLPTRNAWHSHDWGVGATARQMLQQLQQART